MSNKSASSSHKPTPAELMTTASALSKVSSPEEIDSLLHSAANAGLNPIALDKLIGIVCDRTKVSKKALCQQLAACQSSGEQVPQDQSYRLAQIVLNEYFEGGKHLLFAPDGRFYIYGKTHWIPLPDAYLGKVLIQEAKEAFPAAKSLSSLINNAKSLLAPLQTADESQWFGEDPLPVVNCANGEVWIDKTGKSELRPHKSASYLTSCLQITFDPSATCPAYDKALIEIFGNSTDPGDMVRHWNEFVGYAMQPRRDIACFWLLIGHGANGKSKLLETIQRLLGPDAVYNGPIAKFQRDRFNIASLAGKLLFVDDDMSMDAQLDDGLLKTISEAKDLTTRHAYGRHSFKFRCLALPVMASNHYPSTSDSSHGLRRRAMVIPFDRKFNAQEADKDLFPNIWATELPGILNRALEGLVRLRNRNEFKLPADCGHAAQEFMAHANPLVAFIGDQLEHDASGSIFLKEFRAVMTAWANEQGIRKPIPMNTLKRQLEGLGFEVTKVSGNARVKGLKLAGLQLAAE